MTFGQAFVSAEVLEDLRIDNRAEVLLILDDQLQFESQQIAGDRAAKGSLVFNRLKQHADRTQKPVRQILDSLNVVYQSLYIVNAIFLQLDKQVLNQVADLAAVREVISNSSFRIQEIEHPDKQPGRSADQLPWGLELIGVQEVWEMGYAGQGAVIGGQDTGVEWDHPALIGAYRGWNGNTVDHNYNWHDAIREISLLHNDSIIDPSNNHCGLNLSAPCDDAGSSHGTHTMGIMVGRDTAQGFQVGLAPESLWIAVRNMERGFGSPSTYLEGFEWSLAPTDLYGLNPDPGLAPHVINNSWACPELEGCNSDNFEILEQAIDNLKAAGIMVVASAGNGGAAGCRTVNAPPAIFEGTFSVGSVDANDSISSFSSRGPVAVDFSFRLKPNVSAPGRGVFSSVKGGAYGFLTGTSMAGPHVAGLVALMISANSALAGQVDVIEDIIERTAISKFELDTCIDISRRGEIPNALHGYGRIDALAAVRAALELTPVSDQNRHDELNVFPNPAHSIVYFQFDDKSVEKSRLRVFNTVGQMILEQIFYSSEIEVRLDQLSAGLYFYEVSRGQNFSSGLLLKK